jgi:hypothetical protein
MASSGEGQKGKEDTVETEEEGVIVVMVMGQVHRLMGKSGIHLRLIV